MNKSKILVIDDEDIVRTSCVRALTPEGFEVKTAQSGLIGIQMARDETFEIALTDLKMPDMDGIEVLRQIKEISPSTEVIIITGYQTVETAVKSIKLGAFDYIEKPFTPDTLVFAIRKAIEYRNRRLSAGT